MTSSGNLQPPLGPLRVLVVDDNQPSALTLSWTVEAFGHETRVAYSGATALAEAKTFHPHVILLDIGMPVMNGYEVCRAVRSEPDLQTAVVIAQTGWGSPEFRAKGKDAGIDHHLVKPVHMGELEDILETVRKRHVHDVSPQLNESQDHP